MKLLSENKPIRQIDWFYISFVVDKTKEHNAALTTSLYWYIYHSLLTFFINSFSYFLYLEWFFKI